MKIGILNIDRKKYPNLALMKISSFHKTKNDIVEFAQPYKKYDIIYKSKIFTDHTDDKQEYYAEKIIRGGTGYSVTKKLPKEIDKMCPDYTLFNCQHAYGFLTRGCIRECTWCIVPKKEGKLKSYADIKDIIADKKTVVLMDNNVLASEHGIKQIEKIISMKIKVDFNQGLDARLIDKPMANLLSKVKWLKPLRLACDTDSMLPVITKAVKLLRNSNCTPKRYFVYLLVKGIESAHYRAIALKELNLDPFAQAFIDFTGLSAPTKEQKQFCRWVNHKAIFKTVLWSDYNKHIKEKP